MTNTMRTGRSIVLATLLIGLGTIVAPLAAHADPPAHAPAYGHDKKDWKHEDRRDDRKDRWNDHKEDRRDDRKDRWNSHREDRRDDRDRRDRDNDWAKRRAIEQARDRRSGHHPYHP